MDENCVNDFVHKTFKVGDDDTLAEEELVRHVLPYLQAQWPEDKRMMKYEGDPEKTGTSFRDAVLGIKKLKKKGVGHLYALRAASKSTRLVANCLLVYRLCLELHPTANRNVCVGIRDCNAITTAIVALVSEGSTLVSRCFEELFDQNDYELSKMAAEALPKVSSREPLD